ncbi:hypothetical protein [Plantactinospora sp. KLBMP9567]|nr:hypothetical protein [Plantactinospora sp. KLBMP9567]MDW5329428.1 hypothetical protein [Plantactinospora sp. KLBMP9567]
MRSIRAGRASRLHVTWHRWRRHVDLCRTSTMLCRAPALCRASA